MTTIATDDYNKVTNKEYTFNPTFTLIAVAATLIGVASEGSAVEVTALFVFLILPR